jgi:hypothetical protein
LRPAPAAAGIFLTLSLRILPQMPEPIPRRVPLCALAWFLLSVIGLPHEMVGSASRFAPRTRFSAASFRGFSYFVMFRPPRLLVSQIVPTVAAIAARQPRRLLPSRTCVVTFACIGYAIRPTTGNWRNEDFHLARFAALSAAHISVTRLSCWLRIKGYGTYRAGVTVKSGS